MANRMRKQSDVPIRDNSDRAVAGYSARRMTVFCIAALFMILIMAAGCVQPDNAGTNPDNNSVNSLTVAVTILPQKQFVERIAGDRARVIVLIPPGASPHSYEPTPDQMAEISRASVYVKVGSGIELERAWMDKLDGVNPRMTVVNSSRGILLITGYHEDEESGPDAHADNHEEESGTDPHIWLSPKNAEVMVGNTYEGLAAADPLHAAEYRANADAYIRELDELDTGIGREIAQKQIRTFMVYHPAWSYFARDYNLTQIPIEEDGKDPSPAGIENLIRQAKEGNITVIFASPEYSTRSADVIAKEIGGSVALVSPLEEDYLGNIRNVASALAGSMQ